MEYRPWTWTPPENFKETHSSMPRQDAHERASGKASYTRDVYLPGMLYAKILTSPYAHAKIVKIDTSEAEALPGVRDILKYTDADIKHDSGSGLWYEVSGMCNILTLPGESNFYNHPMGIAVVAAEIGLKYEDTVIHEKRSDNSSFFMWQPGGSFSTTFITTQLVMAAKEIKKKLLEYAVQPTPAYNTSHFFKTAGPAAFPGKKPEDLDIRDSMIFEKANPANRKSVREVADIFWDADPAISHPVVGRAASTLTSDGKPDSNWYAMGRQAHFIEVEVDTETGMVDVTNIVCVNDVGHLFNPRGAEAQQYGGAIMGLGRSATEEHVWCPRTGVALNFDLINYHIGTMNDYPASRCIINESHLGYAAFGSLGIGENSGAAMSGITVSAIYNATGKWVMDHPTTPDRVLKALGKI
jgi:CO/xanthine dehydrogenase Mo-binding subunit